MLTPDPVVIAIMPEWKDDGEARRGKIKRLLGFSYASPTGDATVEFADSLTAGLRQIWAARDAGKAVKAILVSDCIIIDKGLIPEFSAACSVNRGVVVLEYLSRHNAGPENGVDLLLFPRTDMERSKLPGFVTGVMRPDRPHEGGVSLTTFVPK